MRDLSSERTELERDGQVVVRGLLTPGEVSRFRALVNAALPKAVEVELPPGNETCQAVFDQYMNLWQADPATAEVTPHRASPNLGDADREVMTVIWFADGARVSEPANDARKLDRLVWLGNTEPGELATGELNPLVGVE